MNVTEWKHRTKWLCTWKVHLFFENNPLNTTVHNMFPCQVGSSLIWLVHSLIAGDFFANNNVSTEKQDQIVDHGPNRVGHSIPISGCYGPWVIVSQFSTPLVAWRPDGMELHRRVFRVLSHRFQTSNQGNPTAKLWQMLCPDKCGCPQNPPSVMFFSNKLTGIFLKKNNNSKISS